MASTIIWLGESETDLWTVDLAEQDTFVVWPKALTEYSQRVTVYVRTENAVVLETLRGRANPYRTDRSGRRYYRLTFKEEHCGIVGFRSADLTFTIGDRKYGLTIKFPINPEHLSNEQFNQMLDDISHWVFSALASPVEMPVGLKSQPAEVILPQEPLLNLINEHIDEIEGALHSIAAAPRRQIQQQYSLSRHETGRQDAVTTRWMLRNPDDSVSLVPRNVASCDVYENQFVCFFLDLLLRRLSFIQRLAKMTKEEREREKEKERRYGKANNDKKIERYERECRRAEEVIHQCEELQRRIRRLRSLDFLRDVHFDTHRFSLHFSLGLTQDFYYGRLFDLYRTIGRDTGMERLDRLRNFIDGLTSMGMERTSQIYEYWTFFAVCRELVRLHFRPEHEDVLEYILTEVIDRDNLTPRFRPGAHITLIGEPQIYGDMKIHVYYEREFGKGNDGLPLACPDVTIEVYTGRQLRGRLILDAKYKNYADGAAEYFDEDRRQVKEKYQDPSKSLDGKIPDSIGAFLLHVTKQRRFENYGACVEENGSWKKNGHRYGFVPVVPGDLRPLRTLLAMLFLIKLEADVAICWVCGSTDVRKQPYRDQSGTLKENKWKCQRCGHEWWMNKCKCGFPLPKGEFSFILQHRDIDPDSSCTGYFCPGCGRCVCGADIEKIPLITPAVEAQCHSASLRG